MPRRARHYIAGQPYHVVQPGNNREPCFIEIEQKYILRPLCLNNVTRRSSTPEESYGVRLCGYFSADPIHLALS